MKREIILTGDGSPTIYLPDLDEHYHSIHGAIQESQHVFIQNGLQEFAHQKNINILEIGLGSCLNALLTAITAKEKDLSLIHYTGIEAFPLTESEQNLMNYAQKLTSSSAFEIQEAINQAPWETSINIHSNFILTKILGKAQDILLKEEEFDLVYFDAFGPRAQAEMWTKELFDKLFKTLKNNGLFVTYCAKGQVKRDLISVGFEVENRPGPPGKREITLAWKRFY
jgi:tRNA U34 5-methylaminomethyl-2-thiouridine-forming methyltransferase MnmC